MGIKTTKTWLVAAACILPLCVASLCPSRTQYWSNDSETCNNCSRCDSSEKKFVIRPCQAHADTVCGPLSDLDIDWSWLKRSSQYHSKKNHKHQHVLNLGDDIVEDLETTTKSSYHNKKHRKHTVPVDNRKHDRKHFIPSESLVSENYDLSSTTYQRPHKHSQLGKSTVDLEKEWKKLLDQSRNRLLHEKEDLLNNLLKEKSKVYNEKHHSNVKLNKPIGNILDSSESVLFHHSSHGNHKKHFSPLGADQFDRMLSHEQERLSISKLLSNERERDRSEESDIFMDPFDFRARAMPTNRLFLGEPSTVSEIMDQDMSDSGDDNSKSSLNADEPDVVAVPFSAAEELVWDWQAIALSSAVVACVLFFSVVAIFTLLHATPWKRRKNTADNDMEEMSVKVGLMSGVGCSAAEGINTSIYLEKLLENQKKSSNIYTLKQTRS